MSTTVFFPYVGGDDIGGSHISSFKLIQSLQNTDGYTPLAGLHRPEGRLADLMREMDIPFVNLPFPDLLEPLPRRTSNGLYNIMAYATRTLPKMRAFIKTHDIGIVHTNDGRMHTNWAPAVALSRAKLVWHHRGAPSARGTNLLAPLLADQIITVSKFAKPVRPIRSIDHKWSVVHSPFDLQKAVDRNAAKAALLGRLDLPTGTHILGYYGEMIARKGPVDFVDAVADFIAAHPDIPVIGLMFGVPPVNAPKLDKAAKARAVERGIEAHIKLMGFLTPIEPYMAATDILLVPALNEPFGRTLIEAMHLGTTVIAYEHGGNPEAIDHGKTGFLIPAKRPAAFAEPIYRVLTNPESTANITAAAQKFARQNLTRDSHLNGVVKVYSAALNS